MKFKMPGLRILALTLFAVCQPQTNAYALIVHDHVSVPADLDDGRAVLNLTP